jgi:hypothetical protein
VFLFAGKDNEENEKEARAHTFAAFLKQANKYQHEADARAITTGGVTEFERFSSIQPRIG